MCTTARCTMYVPSDDFSFAVVLARDLRPIEFDQAAASVTAIDFFLLVLLLVGVTLNAFSAAAHLLVGPLTFARLCTCQPSKRGHRKS